MWKAIAYRRLQALVVVCLAALITACACFGPLYYRAMQQALASDTLQRSAPLERGVSVSSYARGAVGFSSLEHEVPDRIRALSTEPIASARVQVIDLTPQRAKVGSTLQAAAGTCAHVRFGEGRCPRGGREVAISEADARAYGWELGSRIRVTEVVTPGEVSEPAQAGLRVVGLYTPHPGDDWPAMPLTGRSGTISQERKVALSDDWIVDPDTIDGPGAPRWVRQDNRVVFPLDVDAVGADELLELGPLVTTLMARAGEYEASSGGSLTVFSQLPELADRVDRGKAQARVTVPLLMIQLAVLAVVVLWLVLGAATEQRRPEVALARLRGRRVWGAGRLLLGELGLQAAAGVVLGGLGALAASWLVARVVLPGRVPLEVPGSLLVTWAGAAVAVLVVITVSVRRVVGEPVVDLLRRVPARGSAWAVGVVDAMIVAASAMAVLAFVVGGLSGPLGFAAPTLLALTVGLVLAHLVLPVASRSGQRLLLGGRMASGVSLLHVARRPATRRVLALLTVATALLVFSTDALAIGDRNRASAADQENGAALVLNATTTDAAGVREAVRRADPTGDAATTVVTIGGGAQDARTVVAVEPDGFRAVARFTGSDPPAPWRALATSQVDPVRLRGTRVTARLAADVSVDAYDPSSAGSVVLHGLDARGRAFRSTLGAIPPRDTSTRMLAADVPCARGCSLTGLGVVTGPAAEVDGDLVLSDVRADESGPVALGPAARWVRADAVDQATIEPTEGADGSLAGARVSTVGGAEVRLTQGWAAARLPALVTGGAGSRTDGPAFQAPGLDGVAREMTEVGSLTRVPGAPADASVVNLEMLLRDGAVPEGGERVQVWLAEDDAGLLARVREALRAQGIATGTATSLDEVRRTLDRTTPAWSLQLALVVGGAGLLLAALVLVVVAATTWRLRARDLAALRMSGLSRRAVRRIATLEQLPAVVLAVLAGTASGVAGAHYAIGQVPLFSVTPEVSTLDVSTAWGAVGWSAAAALLVLVAVGWSAGRALAGRAALERVREAL